MKTLSLVAAVIMATLALPAFSQIVDKKSVFEMKRQKEEKRREGKEIIDGIKGWKKGDDPPKKLLTMQDEIIPPLMCGFGARRVGIYVQEIKNPDLLEALLLHPDVSTDCFRATTYQILYTQGCESLAKMLKENVPVISVAVNMAKEENIDKYLMKGNELPKRTIGDLAVLIQLLQSDYILFRLMYVDTAEVPVAKAKNVFEMIRNELQQGESWKNAIRKCADMFPDPSGGTYRHLTGGFVSENGFDLGHWERFTGTDEKHLYHIYAHFEYLFRAGEGIFLITEDDGYYLYQVVEHYKAEQYFGKRNSKE